MGDNTVERNANNVMDRWIAERVHGLSFCDIGGIGLKSKNERVSTASRHGATRSVMIDFRREDFPMWSVFHDVMKLKNVDDYECLYGINLESPTLPEETGVFDFVYSTGILYHAPSPMLGLYNLSRITGKYLIVNTVTAPSVIENRCGRLEIPESALLFLPSLTGQDREILKEHYVTTLNGWDESKFDRLLPRHDDESATMPYVQKREPLSGHYWENQGGLSYTPYWWVWHESAFRTAVEMLDFNILAEHNPKGHSLALLCERR